MTMLKMNFIVKETIAGKQYKIFVRDYDIKEQDKKLSEQNNGQYE